MMQRLFIYALLMLMPVISSAASDDFTITTLVGTDTTPPSVPAPVNVVPVSPNQITVSWGPSTDNFAIGGYRVARDGNHIATTSLTSFSDTGLTPSTTYSYTVDAFDIFNNFSSTSASIATTTFPLPVVPTTTVATTTTSNATAIPALRSFAITTKDQSANLSFTSYGPTRYIVRFGRSSMYELGTISTNIFNINHEAVLNGLEPGTKYFVEVTLINGFGAKQVVRRDQFTTAPAVTSFVPQSVSGLRGEVRASDAFLSWNNPNTFETVRVVRSHLFYPSDIYDGVTVYQGEATEVTDKEVFINNETVYYAIFVVTKDGRVSAPAVLRLQRQGVSVPGVTDGSSVTSTATMTPSSPDMSLSPVYEQYLMPSDIFLTVKATTYTFDTIRSIPVGEEVLISIPYKAVPNSLKTILVSVYDPKNNALVTTYLLKLRGDGEAYEASFEASRLAGEGKIMIELYDYERVVVRRITRTIIYVGTDAGFSLMGVSKETVTYWRWSIIPLLICLYCIWRIGRRLLRREDNR